MLSTLTKKLGTFLFTGFVSCSQAAVNKELDIKNTSVLVYNDYAGEPDSQGIFENISLNLLEYKQIAYYRGTWWPYGGNQVHGEVLNSKSKEGGIFAIAQLNNDNYLAILPLCGEQAFSWFAPENGKLKLNFGHKGTATVTGDFPVVAWADGKTPYEASAKVWKMATEVDQIKGYMKLREDKKYPEMFKYLGWCSWEEFKKNINEEKLIKAFNELESSELPIKYFLIDDGHFGKKTLKPNGKFPNGYKPFTDLCSNDGIKWVGMWHALLGTAGGVAKNNPPAIKDIMTNTSASNSSFPKHSQESIERYMKYLTSRSKKDEIDFLKVDFCGSLMGLLAGANKGLAANKYPKTNEYAVKNPCASAVQISRGYQKVVEEDFNGLLNCNWQVAPFIFNSGENSIGRCGPDYKLNVKRARECVYMTFSTIPWLGQIMWGDHDMFHSTDKLAARMMAISKAISGGAVYLSDNPKHMKAEIVWPLCYKNGELLRPLAPGAPLPEDIFLNLDSKQMYRTMAPLANKSVAIGCYNLQGDGKTAEPIFTSRITTDHYQAASSMIQPYPGEWQLPEEGLLVYDFNKKSVTKMPENGYEVKIAGFSENLLQLSPITKGWSVIGRTDKYLAATAVKINNVSSTQLEVTMIESGPLSIWLKNGKPSAQGIDFIDKGNGLFTAELPVGEKNRTLVITKR